MPENPACRKMRKEEMGMLSCIGMILTAFSLVYCLWNATRDLGEDDDVAILSLDQFEKGGTVMAILMLPPGNYGFQLMLGSARCPGCSHPGGCPYGGGDGFEMFSCPFGVAGRWFSGSLLD